ncbi:MAG: methionyl-tRNA formyltransferase [Planctomycetota bacterium]
MTAPGRGTRHAPDRPRGRGRVVEPSDLVQLARSRDVDVLQPKTTKDESFYETLRGLEPEVVLVASFGEILRDPVLEAAPHGAINVHASLLPRHRGASPIQAAIAQGDETTGVTIQRIVRALDEGDILLAKETPIGARETSGQLLQRLADLGAEAAVEALDQLADGTAVFTPQDHEQATYARKIPKERGLIDWSRSSIEIDRHVRAMSPWPGARSSHPAARGKTRELVVLEVSPFHLENAADLEAGGVLEAGSVVEAGRDFVVATSDGYLRLERLKPAGKPEMTGEAYLRGTRLEQGTLLG